MSTAELVPAQQVSVTTVSRNDGVLQVIADAARDPNVDPAKLTALLELKERVDAREAEIEFNRAFAQLMLEVPRVQKKGTIDLGKGKVPFAKWEDVDTVIRPLLAKYGFTLSFSCEPSKGAVIMTGHLTHVGGHSRKSTMELPPDAGPGRNALQAVGSSHSYGKRYIALDMLNIVTVGEDNNGNSAGVLTQEQRDRIYDMLNALELNQERTQKFLKLAGADSVEEIQRYRFDDLMKELRHALRKKQEAGQ